MKLNYKNFFIGCVCFQLFGVLFCCVIIPEIVKTMLKRQVVLKPGTDMRAMWSQIPFPLDFLIYVFNITNPDEVIQGGKIKLQEIGPYYLEEWKEKFNQIDDDEKDTITFHMRNTFIFRPEKSSGLTGKETIILPHLLLQSLAIVVKRDREPMLPLVAKAIPQIFPHDTAFLKTTFLDIFYNGIAVNCSSQDFNAKAVCSAFETDVKGIEPLNTTFYKFSLFGTSNGTDIGTMTAYRGIKNIRNLGRIKSYNDEPELDVWNGDECNQFVGTDSTIFPPFLKKNERLWAFTPDICRSMAAVFEKPSSYAGLPTSRYTLDMGDLKADKKLHCFCTDPPDGCPPKGTMDLFPCIGAPLVASMPHFYKGDTSLFDHIEGLCPNKDDHGVYIEFELMSGTPLAAAKRLQFNLQMEPVDNIDQMKTLPKAILPIFWIEEGVQLNKTYTNKLKYQLFLVLKINSFIKYSIIIVGTLGMLIFRYLATI